MYKSCIIVFYLSWFNPFIYTKGSMSDIVKMVKMNS